MPGVTPHDFNDLYPSMRTCGCPRVLDDFSDVAQRRVEPESVISARQILVDRFGNADNSHAFLGEPGGHAQRVLATGKLRALAADDAAPDAIGAWVRRRIAG